MLQERSWHKADSLNNNPDIYRSFFFLSSFFGSFQACSFFHVQHIMHNILYYVVSMFTYMILQWNVNSKMCFSTNLKKRQPVTCKNVWGIHKPHQCNWTVQFTHFFAVLASFFSKQRHSSSQRDLSTQTRIFVWTCFLFALEEFKRLSWKCEDRRIQTFPRRIYVA